MPFFIISEGVLVLSVWLKEVLGPSTNYRNDIGHKVAGQNVYHKESLLLYTNFKEKGYIALYIQDLNFSVSLLYPTSYKSLILPTERVVFCPQKGLWAYI